MIDKKTAICRVNAVISDINNQYIPDVDVDDLQEVIDFIQSQEDQIQSLWSMLEEMKQSDIANHKEEITESINDLLNSKRKIAKVSEA